VDDLVLWSASALARAVRTGELSSVEVVEAHLRRIEAVNPALNAVVHLDRDGALAAARAADATRARTGPGTGPRALGPLHGVPVTVKDNLDVAGMPCTGGTLGRAAAVAISDATVVARLREVGAIVLGKTNLPEFALAPVTDNLVYGRTNNPYDLSRTPGGSSGGEAAIVAAGGSPLGIGNDMAGSVRQPAHFCGLAGLKPTTGRVPLTGYFAPIDGILKPLWQNGPLARRVEDLALALAVMAGPDGHDPAVPPVPLGEPSAVPIPGGGLRVAVHADNGIAPPTAETAEAVGRAASALHDAGATVEEDRPPALADAPGLFHRLCGAALGSRLRAQVEAQGTTEMHPTLVGLLDNVERSPGTTRELAELLAAWDAYREAMLAFMRRYDAILCPVDAGPAPQHGPVRTSSYAYAYNLTGWPAAVVRAGSSPEGLPIGVQVVAGPWREDVALALAGRVEAATGGWAPPPL
jgi:amidase